MRLTTDRYSIRPLKKEDGYLLKAWGSFEDPLFYGYEYNDLTEPDLNTWYKMKTKSYGSEYFSIFSKENELIGYIGLKEINSKLRISKMGIVLDPNFVSKGIGSEVMRDFLNYFFFEKNFRRLDLEVNAWNTRAINLYKKFGFSIIKESLISFENQEIDITKKEYRDFFVEKNGEIFSKIYLMRIEKGEVLDESRNRK